METNCTPGPWYEAGTGNHQGLVISEATSANVAVAYDKKDGRLIAAAPDLYDALAWIVTFCAEHPEWFGDGTPDEGAEFEWLDHAHRLLTKVANTQ